VRLLNSILQIPRMTRLPSEGRGRGDFRTGFLRMRRSPVRLPRCVLLFSGRDSASSNNMVTSNETRWLRSETRVWIGNNQTRTFLQPQIHRKRGASRKRSRREGKWERERLMGNQSRFCGADAYPIHIPGEDASAEIQIQNLPEISRSSKDAP
jgi:hypothetical protein